MELHQLEAFIEISKRRNLTLAAEHLHISASALSGRIKSLEEQWDVVLFQRSAKGMVPTAQGQALLPLAEAHYSRPRIAARRSAVAWPGP